MGTALSPAQLRISLPTARHEAVRQLQADVRSGKRWVVDLDLEAFFDTVNHDRLVVRTWRDMCRTRGATAADQPLSESRGEGRRGHASHDTRRTARGAVVASMANVVLDELDWELERRGHRFARYADDCNIVVGSTRAGERVMASVTRLIEESRAHSECEKERGRSALESASFWGLRSSRGAKLKVADKARETKATDTGADTSYNEATVWPTSSRSLEKACLVGKRISG
ncbi:MAG: hypothetical protein KF778_09820 [Rhodocyclaceae bacterium]|nr:hypothetical protein [Rhodocyclaceae bacterium]